LYCKDLSRNEVLVKLMRMDDSIIEIPINPGLLIANHSQF